MTRVTWALIRLSILIVAGLGVVSVAAELLRHTQ